MEWHSTEIETLKKLHQAGLSIREIADNMLRSYDSIRRKLALLLNPVVREKERVRNRVRRQRKPRTTTSDDYELRAQVFYLGCRVHIPEHVQADRERRSALEYATVTAAFFGDPIEKHCR